ncbi:MAG TPA: DUF4197 family protein [Verrucomicrobiota bacterium]|nr:DUF4197 family protein [Verrucomicrobiota bacterium]HNU52899.1 DUF4197 family protein [Verrucomicrobiota bacterium]
MARLSLLLALAPGSAWGQAPAPVLDTKPAFMQIVTNYTHKTNIVIVTNYVVVTNAIVTTNFYNAQGQLLMPVGPDKTPLPGLIPVPQTKPAGPDPAVVKATQLKATQLRAVRDVLILGLASSSNQISAPGSFSSNIAHQIQIPQGVTSFDRKKSQTLSAAMNLTAEKAAPEALALLTKTAAQFASDDPAALLKGETHAVTQAFLTAHREALEPQVLAIVQQAAVGARLREAYNAVMLKGGGLLGSVLGSGPTVDIDAHVSQGLWRVIADRLADQERLIRTDAAARKTPALKEALSP